jgi:7-cyano-7-deazaguanine synthase in queuosine biosynthesis
MATEIRVDIPQIQDDTIRTQITVALHEGRQVTATLQSDAINLVPWMNDASPSVLDFCLFSQFVYGIDRIIPRRPNSVDGWSRELQVSLPVYCLQQWRNERGKVQELLSFLTGDYWNISFYKNKMDIPEIDLEPEYNEDFSKVQLFSGGLDSLIGAIDELERSNRQILLVSHYDRNMHGPKKDQGDLAPKMQGVYGNRFVHLPSIQVNIANTSLNVRETTSRSRSILFLGLALLLADKKGKQIVVPENGTVSVNYPLSPSRRSACSTRTTHPWFLKCIQELWTSLEIDSVIIAPYWNKTKGGMVSECLNQRLLNRLIPLSNSCGKRGHRAHWHQHGTHCGICLPCFYRQASLFGRRDSTEYGNSISNYVDSKTDKWQDFGALLEYLKRDVSEEEFKREIISNGLRDLTTLSEYIALMRDSRNEVREWVLGAGNARVRNQF